MTRAPAPPTLSGRISLRLIIVTLMALVAQVGFVAYDYTNDADELARTTAEFEIASLRREAHFTPDGRFHFEMPEALEQRYEQFPDNYALQMVALDGHVLVARNEKLFADEPFDRAAGQDLVWKSDPTPAGLKRVLTKRIDAKSAPYYIRVAMVDDPAAAYWTVLLHEMADHVMLPIVPLTLAMLVVVLLVVRSALAPLGVAARKAGAVDPRQSHFRIGSAGMPAEVASLTGAIDRLLDRIDDVVRSQKAFAGNVAHELRTPLALLNLELDRIGGDDARRAKEDVQAMSRLVDQLLRIARLDALAFDPDQRVDLAQIAGEVVARLAPLAIDDGKELALVDNGALPVVGDADAIAGALRNLIENALRVTPAGGTVMVEAGPGPEVGVLDEGPGLPAEGAASLFERFTQGDRKTSGSAGLGLAIVAKTMDVHGGRVRAANRREQGAAFRLIFPEAS